MEKSKKLIIVGTGEFGETAFEYFSADSAYEVVGFAVEREFRKANEMMGCPVVDFEAMETLFPPTEYEAFVAVTYIKLNRVRMRLFQECKKKGYTCASFVSPYTFRWDNVEIGENCFIFENNTLQRKVKIGDNVVLHSGNTISHQTVVEDHCWLAPGGNIAGLCNIGRGSFLGTSITLGDNVSLAEDTVLGAGAVTVKSLKEPGLVWVGCPAKKTGKSAYEQFHILEENFLGGVKRIGVEETRINILPFWRARMDGAICYASNSSDSGGWKFKSLSWVLHKGKCGEDRVC